MLLTDFDASRQAVINPDMLFSPVPDLPETVVSCFSHVTFERMLNMAADVRVLAELGDANAKYPIYRGLWQGTPLTFALAMVARRPAWRCWKSCTRGCEAVRRIRQLRRAESADSRLRHHHPDRRRARRRHELPLRAAVGRNSGESEIPRGVRGDSARNGRGLHRRQSVDDGRLLPRNRAKVALRKAQGCVCVDMECSALMALAQFRGIDVFEFFYAGDNLDREQWDPRSLSTHAKLDEKDRAAYLALELARKITL